MLGKRGVTFARLSKAWVVTSSADRDIVRDAVLQTSPNDAVNAKQLFEALTRAAARAGAIAPTRRPLSDPVYKAYIDYFQGRVQREIYERRF